MNREKQQTLLKVFAILIFAFFCNGKSSAQHTALSGIPKGERGETNAKTLKIVDEHIGPVVGTDHPDVLESNNKSGFETGQIVKVNDVYHMFVNEMFERPHRDLRISYWTSTDAANWERHSTVVKSVPGRTHTNPRAEVWVTGVVFNEEENAWNIFYVAYRAGDSTRGEITGNDYEGNIWRARSIVLGREGVAGPYADMNIVMKPDENTQHWEGEQAVACFNPYKVGNMWYSPYDGHNHVPRGEWPTGLAFASKLSGPWKRMPEGFNPLSLAEVFTENEIVTQMKDGRYLMIYDSFGDHEIGYSLSLDGLHWSKETRVKVQSQKNRWAMPGDHHTRTPLCAIEEDDGTFTVVYTAMMKLEDKNFYAIGKCSLAWQE
ncbi:hypothetical protein H8S90_12125 [Olivibacter sp. SDN3]|uniref:hypothetical protein n=1 Tax=Olivibacter sp. SDN3 TaxID=2764720 RepID=UPI001651086D|nr:hypothetical protein [Olivibacter sp. SDN3]QNL52248.1 hypothetical protein H8S90_12125 [Olivibacter sp. SDN3]